MKKHVLFISILFALILILTACNGKATQDTGAIMTAAAETVVADLTRNAPKDAPTTTPTPTPTTEAPVPAETATATQPPPAPTATATQSCDLAEFVEDVTVPDGSEFKPGEAFRKTWRLKNVGACAWTMDYKLVFVDGDLTPQNPSLAELPLSEEVAPGETIDLSVDLIAPPTSGEYTGYWGLQNAAGARIAIPNGYTGNSFYVQIVVGQTVQGLEFVSWNLIYTCTADQYVIKISLELKGSGTITYEWAPGWFQPPPFETLEVPGDGVYTLTYEIPLSAAQGVAEEFLTIDFMILEPKQMSYGAVPLSCAP